ncbi:putative reverse transcriptase domain-containing protein [Tanacetum coccineum]
MRQRRWIELFSDYECEIRYHPGKANVLADALSRKERLKPRRVRAMTMTIQAGMRETIQAAQSEALKQKNVLMENLHGLDQQMEKKEGETDKTVPLVLRNMYWWPGMKRDIATYVNLHDEHGVPVSIISDRDGRFTSRCWQTVQKALETRLDMSTDYHPQMDGQKTTDKVVLIKEKLKAARDRQKSYADNRRKPLEFEVGDRVMLKVSPWKGVIHFGKKGKLTPRYVGPFEILKRISPVAYRLRLPEEFEWK